MSTIDKYKVKSSSSQSTSNSEQDLVESKEGMSSSRSDSESNQKTSTDAPLSNSIDHLSYYCPGLHDKTNRQDIKRMTFRQLFSLRKRLIIPIVQRRYCWNGNTIYKWFEDVVRGQRDHIGTHNTGNVVFKKSNHQEDNHGYIVIDGQQRLTTTFLFLVAVRDSILELQKKCSESEFKQFSDILKTVDDIVYISDKTTSLTPSFHDREPFQRIVSGDETKETEKDVSYQTLAYSYFFKQIKAEMNTQRVRTVPEMKDFFSTLIHQQLDLMGVTFCEILNEINLAQVFLWLQEKSLLGEAAELFNPAPGIFFTSVDMIRNLLLAPILSTSMKEQNSMFKEIWSDPIESFFLKYGPKNIEIFNKCLEDYVKEKSEKLQHVSKAEKTYLKVLSGMKSASPQSKMYITTYAKFISILEKMNENSEDSQIKVSKQLSMDISQFIKIYLLKITVNK